MRLSGSDVPPVRHIIQYITWRSRQSLQDVFGINAAGQFSCWLGILWGISQLNGSAGYPDISRTEVRGLFGKGSGLPGGHVTGGV